MNVSKSHVKMYMSHVGSLFLYVRNAKHLKKKMSSSHATLIYFNMLNFTCEEANHARRSVKLWNNTYVWFNVP